ncbi:uncharacterized protein LOC102808906 [Saccoglossus kowalevskii]
MVRKQSAGKHWITNGRTVRNDHNSIRYKRDYAACEEVSKCITRRNGNIGREEEEEIESEFHNYLDDGMLQFTKCFRDDPGVKYSLNKRKRWELPEMLRQSVLDRELHKDLEFRVIMEEKHDGYGLFSSKGGSRPNCIKVCDGKSDNPVKKPKKHKYAQARDFLAKPKPPRRQRQQREEFDNTELEDEITLKYIINHPVPPNQHPVCRETSKSFGWKKDFAYCHKSACKSKSEKVHNYMYWHGHSINELKTMRKEHIDDHIDYDVYIDTKNSCQKPDMPSISSIMHNALQRDELVNNPAITLQHRKLIEHLPNNTNMATSTPIKMHHKGSTVFFEEREVETNIQESKDEVQDLSIIVPPKQSDAAINIDKPSIVLKAHSESLNLKEVINGFGDSYLEGFSVPHKFSVDITSSVIASMYDRGETKLAKQLQDFGDPLYTVFDETGMRDDDDDIKRIRVSLFGCKHSFHDHLQTMLDSYYKVNHVYTVAEIIEMMLNVIESSPVQSIMVNYGTVRKIPSNLASSCITFDRLRSVAGWHTESLTTYQAYQDNIKASANENEHQNIINVDITTQQEYCAICYDDISDHDGTCLMRCRHWFCNTCWKMHLASRVRQGDMKIMCPEYKCGEVVDRVTLMSLMSVHQYNSYIRQQNEAYLNSNDKYQWCPSQTCGRIVKVDCTSTAAVPVNCVCGRAWCSKCKEEPHWPATCQQAFEYLELRKDKGDDNTFTTRVINYVRVKKCPFCKLQMEKNGGCPQMSCRCGESFCWSCLAAWSKHYGRGGWKCPVSSHDNFETVYLVDATNVRFCVEFYNISIRHHKARRYDKLRKFKVAARSLCSILQSKKTKASRKLSRKVYPSFGSVSDVSSDTSGYSSSSDDEELGDYKQLATKICKLYSEMVYLAEHIAVLCGNCSNRMRSSSVLLMMWEVEFIITRLTQIVTDGEGKTMDNLHLTLNNLCRMSEKVIKTLLNSVPYIHDRLGKLNQKPKSISK